jgi:subtilisin family serine protease
MWQAPRNQAAIPKATTVLAVSYDRSSLAGSLTQVAARERALGATFVRSYDFPHIGTALRMISVPTASAAAVQTALRTQAGVKSVAVSGGRRYALTVNAPYYTNDPYFNGFTALQNTNALNPAPSTYQVLPYAESSPVPGQWDMHAIGLEHAFAYSQAANGSGHQNVNALGSSNIKIAIIDTGVDAGQPELTSKMTYQKCIITSYDGSSVSTGNYATDELGHGTDVAGIAASESNNAFGFTGAGGNAVIYGYRVFPRPNDDCNNEFNNDPQCGADPADIGSAIMDAVNNGVNVISMSLGGGTCSGSNYGGDDSPAEGTAVEDAIAAHIIVIAASGNDYASTVDAPACDTGVIAVGATALADGSPTGTSVYTRTVTNPSPTNIVEYVASYSGYDSTNPGAWKQTSSWGIVAPGGDPNSSEMSANAAFDNLHWIANIWTTTPYQAYGGDTTFTGDCRSDYPHTGGAADCQILIAGTSMATPHVAGAAALILAVNSAYQTPAAMKQLLCQTADDLGGDTHEGCGRLNVYRAMAVALGDTNPP